MRVSSLLILHLFEQTITDAPLLIALLINFSPLNLFPLIAKKI